MCKTREDVNETCYQFFILASRWQAMRLKDFKDKNISFNEIF